MESVITRQNKLLLIVDMQNDFLEGGSLAVQQGNMIIAPINRLIVALERQNFLIWATADTHPINHCSFASVYRREIFSKRKGKILWPDHCVVNTYGRELSKGLLRNMITMIFPKGQNPNADSYSAIRDDAGTFLPLYHALKAKKINYILIVGLALDYCVIKTINDINKYFPTIQVICDLNCTRMIDQRPKIKTLIIKQTKQWVCFIR